MSTSATRYTTGAVKSANGTTIGYRRLGSGPGGTPDQNEAHDRRDPGRTGTRPGSGANEDKERKGQKDDQQRGSNLGTGPRAGM